VISESPTAVHCKTCLMEQMLGVLFLKAWLAWNEFTKIRGRASKRSFLNRTRLQQFLAPAKRHMAEVDTNNVDELSPRQEAVRCASNGSAKQDSSPHFKSSRFLRPQSSWVLATQQPRCFIDLPSAPT
jgi:hypothetical protein